jgi:hypothetical protein
MADKKKQHFVSQFYLKLFSNREPVINVFNIKRFLPILKPASIRNQCCEDYFYGEDLTTDNALTELENVVAPMLKEIIEKQQLPNKMSKEYVHVLFFILSQHNRTKHSGEAYDEETNKILKIMAQDRPEVSSALEHWRIVAKNPTALPLYGVATAWVLAVDLEAKVICNRSREPFVTSDHPVVYYNQYMENCKTESCTGLGSRGLQIFFPISPRVMLHLYDPGVYKVGSSKDGFCEIYSDAEARKMNELQWLNALENVYYSNEVNQDSVLSQAKRSVPRRRTDLVKVEEHAHPTDKNRSLLHIQGVDLKTRLQPSFTKVKKSMRRIPLSERERVRSPYLMIARSEFEKQVEGGKYREGEFLKFLADLETGRTKVVGLSRE